jgi:hypothetical protein
MMANNEHDEFDNIVTRLKESDPSFDDTSATYLPRQFLRWLLVFIGSIGLLVVAVAARSIILGAAAFMLMVWSFVNSGRAFTCSRKLPTVPPFVTRFFRRSAGRRIQRR